MAKRKLGASVIILCIAAVTLISGTYAWFLVGGFASLFDIGFDVVESSGGLELQGDLGTAHMKDKGATDDKATVSPTNWGNYLMRTDYTPASFIVNDGGFYKPVSSRDAVQFIRVGMEGNVFQFNGEAPKKADYTDESADICYNNFTFRIRSTTEAELVGDAENKTGAFMQIRLNGDEEKDDKIGENDGAAVAARVAVTLNSDDSSKAKTTIYSIDGETYQAVTTNTSDLEIIDNNNNEIIDAGDDDYTKAGLAAPASPVDYKALREDTDSDGVMDSAVRIYLGNVPGNTTNGMQVTVKVWLEGNDKDCVDLEGRSIAGSKLVSRITFGQTD